ncbi:uncharacterized protein F5147DRAFT_652920 [Suillus discolor]|uniref:Uncharacterized protein n=1 Tax=Suillus discolor TaxID=1912936 RepID=A0A9P7F5V4_9AGAM|nr:uncharacterized protein F5147DRAFT_652920 [Suillus discolor]KAG2108197.1 hypothetical protein F5147DRAFT_652920 [Suillus discolor]
MHETKLGEHKIHYYPVWDFHGLPIENKALQESKMNALLLPPNVIHAAAKAMAEHEMKMQQKEFEQYFNKWLTKPIPHHSHEHCSPRSLGQGSFGKFSSMNHYILDSNSKHGHCHSSFKKDALVVAKDHLLALEHIIGPHKVIAEIKGHRSGLLQGPTDIICHVDDAGKFSLGVAHVVGEEAVQTLVCQEVLKGGNKAIVRLLESIGSLSDRATSQWFANLDSIKDNVLHALKDLAIYWSHSFTRVLNGAFLASECGVSQFRLYTTGSPYRCDRCGYYCTLLLGHLQQEHETRHESMSSSRWAVDGPDDKGLEVDDRCFSSNDEGNNEVQHIPKPNQECAKDFMMHNLFWRQAGFKAPNSWDNQADFAKWNPMIMQQAFHVHPLLNPPVSDRIV